MELITERGGRASEGDNGVVYLFLALYSKATVPPSFPFPPTCYKPALLYLERVAPRLAIVPEA